MPSKSSRRVCLEVLLVVSRLGDSNLDAKLASKMDQQGNFEHKVNQVCFRKLACWGQLEVRRAGHSVDSKTCVKPMFFSK